MIGLQGEIFHIDYGHILDHRKKKLGYDREPHEFILTTDFVKVFAHGPDKELIRKELGEIPFEIELYFFIVDIQPRRRKLTFLLFPFIDYRWVIWRILYEYLM